VKPCATRNVCCI